MKLAALTRDQLIARIRRTNKTHNRKLKALESAARVSLVHENLKEAQLKTMTARAEKAETEVAHSGVSGHVVCYGAGKLLQVQLATDPRRFIVGETVSVGGSAPELPEDVPFKLATLDWSAVSADLKDFNISALPISGLASSATPRADFKAMAESGAFDAANPDRPGCVMGSDCCCRG
jgi:hypothetical protein